MSGRKRKQLNLGSRKGFKKLVQYRGEKVEVDIPTVATVKYVTCDICKQEFVNNQWLGCHKFKCEKEHNINKVLSTNQFQNHQLPGILTFLLSEMVKWFYLELLQSREIDR